MESIHGGREKWLNGLGSGTWGKRRSSPMGLEVDPYFLDFET